MARELDIYPGITYERPNGTVGIVFDQSPKGPDGQDLPEGATIFCSFTSTRRTQPDLHPGTLSTEEPTDIVTMLPTLSRDEMIELLSLRGLPERFQDKFKQDMIDELDTNLARGPRRIVAPNLDA